MIEFNKHNEFVWQLNYDMVLACNNRCDYCYQLPILDNEKLFNREMFETVIKQIGEFKQKYPEYRLDICLLGGEPLLIVNKVLEFIERVQDDKTTIHILTNFNFKPNTAKINRLFEAFATGKFSIMVSVHDSSRLDWVFENIKRFRTVRTPDDTAAYILSRKTNLPFVRDFAGRMIAEFGPKSYKIRSIVDAPNRDKPDLFDWDDPDVQDIVENSDLSGDDVNMDGQWFDSTQSRKMDLKNISSQYYTICKVNSHTIDFYGKVTTRCEHPLSSHISEGITPKEVYCHNYNCQCNTDAYKKLLRPK